MYECVATRTQVQSLLDVPNGPQLYAKRQTHRGSKPVDGPLSACGIVVGVQVQRLGVAKMALSGPIII